MFFRIASPQFRLCNGAVFAKFQLYESGARASRSTAHQGLVRPIHARPTGERSSPVRASGDRRLPPRIRPKALKRLALIANRIVARLRCGLANSRWEADMN